MEISGNTAGGNVMDSMMGIFYEQSSRLISELRTDFSNYKDKEKYGQDLIQEVFRVVHTLKADAAMMLFDGIAYISKKFENLLYCFRNGPKVIEDTERFDNVLCEYMNYIEKELTKIPSGKAMKEPPEYIAKDIDDYVVKIKEQYELVNSNVVGENNISGSSKKKTRQIYYIPGNAVSSVTEKKSSEAKVSAAGTYKNEAESENGVIVIKKSEVSKMRLAVAKLDKIVMKLHSGDLVNEEFIKEIGEVQKELSSVTDKFTKGDFAVVAKKMELLVDEMAETLHKNIRLSVKGQECMIDKTKRDKISSALIHLIRNAADHGIEDLETRERYGKSPMGLIKLEFSQAGDKIKITVEDDGAGISSEKVLCAARKAGVIKDDKKEYSRQDIMDLLLINGVSTTNVPNDYSGRGVGMDVMNHNIKELGGTLNITSEEGFGTKIEITV